MARRSNKQRRGGSSKGPSAPERSGSDAVEVEAEASVPGQLASKQDDTQEPAVEPQEELQEAPQEPEAPSVQSDNAAPAEPDSEPAEAKSEPAPAEPEKGERWVVVRFTGKGLFADTLGGKKPRLPVRKNGTFSIPESQLEEARGKGFEFVRNAGE